MLSRTDVSHLRLVLFAVWTFHTLPAPSPLWILLLFAP